MDDQQQPNTESNWEYKQDQPTAGFEDSGMAESTGVPLPSIPAVEWSASEYIAHEKGAGWYAALFGGGGLLVIFIFVTTRDILASIVVLLACATISVYAGRKPSTKNYKLDEKGVRIDDKFRGYGEYRSFSVVEEGVINSVWLKPIKRLAPPVVMYFSPEDEQRIIDVLSNFLPHEDRELDAVDRFSKRIRF